MSEFKKGEAVSVIKSENQVSNTYYVDSCDEESVLLFHVRYPSILLRYPIDKVWHGVGEAKQGEEKTLDFCREWAARLSPDELEKLESFEMVMVVARRLSDSMKFEIAQMLGTIARYRLNGEVESAISIVSLNSHELDSFNLKWYHNFSKFFSGEQPVRSKKQRTALFNIAGFIMSQIKYYDQT